MSVRAGPSKALAEAEPGSCAATQSSTLRRSCMKCAKRSSRVTSITSPGESDASSHTSCGRSHLAPLTFSRKTLPSSAASSWASSVARGERHETGFPQATTARLTRVTYAKAKLLMRRGSALFA